MIIAEIQNNLEALIQTLATEHNKDYQSIHDRFLRITRLLFIGGNLFIAFRFATFLINLNQKISFITSIGQPRQTIWNILFTQFITNSLIYN